MAQTAIYGQKSSFSATDSSLRINLEDVIVKYPDYKFPVLKRLNNGIFKKEVLSYEYRWMERDLRPIKAGVVSQVGQSATSVTVDTAGVFATDDIALNPRTGEHMLVTAVAGGVSLTLERGYQGTSASGSALIEADELVRVGKAGAEGAASKEAVTLGAGDLFNYTQKFEDIVFMSDAQYKGFIMGDETQAQSVDRIQQELMEGLQLTAFLGVRYRNAAAKRSTMGGIKYFVDTYASGNAINFGGASTWSSDLDALNKFEDAVEKLATRMGNKPTIYATYKALRKLRLVQDDTVRTTRNDKTRGIGVVDTLSSGMGDLDIVQIIDRSGVMDNLVFLVDDNAVGIKPRKGRGWFTEERPFDGDGHKWAVLGEYTMKVETPQATIAYINNLGIV